METRSVILALALLITATLAGCDVMKSISVPANAHWSHGKSTVNGDITVGANAVVEGDLITVNGDVRVASGAHTGELVTVNGDIRLAQAAHSGELTNVSGDIILGGKVAVDGDVTTVNGNIRAADGTQVEGDITDVNGKVALCGTTVKGDAQFVNTIFLLGAHTSVSGNILAKKPDYDSSKPYQPVLVVGPHAVVTGSIRFERPGKLYVSDSAVIHAVEGITPEKFSGAAPAGVALPICPSD